MGTQVENISKQKYHPAYELKLRAFYAYNTE